MIKSKKPLKEITGEEDFTTLEEYRSYLISTLTSLQEQSPVFEEQDVFMPEEKPPFKEIPVQENFMQATQFVKTEHEIEQQVMHDADEFQYKKFWLLNDSPAPSLVELGLQNHPDAERLNYRLRHPTSKKLLQNSTFENPMVDEFFNIRECERAICGPDEVMFLFPDTSKSEIYDDITTMKYLIKYKLNVGPLPISVHEPEPTQAQLDCLHAYIEAHLIPWGRHISSACLRSKILKLQNKYKNLVEVKGEKPNAQGFSMQVRKFMVDLLKKTWEYDQEVSANLG